MPRRRSGFGQRMDFGVRTPTSNVRALRGTYPNKERNLGTFGSTAYPSVLETYNRDSDFKRWQAGAQIFFGAGKTWSEIEIYARAYFFNTLGQALSYDAKEIVHLFPATGSPEGAWHTAVRTRGSLIFDVALDPAHITLNTSDPDPSKHTLIYRVGSFFSVEQVNRLNFFIGDQFEDSANAASYPSGLIAQPVDAIALTLVAVNASAQSLTFDLSSPHRRVSRGGRLYWKKETYDPDAPLLWNTSGARFLCSSHKFFCSCPDHLGGTVASLSPEGQQSSPLDRFPLPSANRTPRRTDGTPVPLSPWEGQGAGQFRQWRTLPQRRDQRRDCKHIHCLRWECGVPWLEPNDYPSRAGGADFSLEQGIDDSSSIVDILDFFRRQNQNWNRFALATADTVGLTLFPGGDPRTFKRLSALPILWTDATAPDPALCRANDWWLPRGSQSLYLFSPQSNSFQSSITVSGESVPILQIVAPGSQDAPVLVR